MLIQEKRHPSGDLVAVASIERNGTTYRHAIRFPSGKEPSADDIRHAFDAWADELTKELAGEIQ